MQLDEKSDESDDAIAEKSTTFTVFRENRDGGIR